MVLVKVEESKHSDVWRLSMPSRVYVSGTDSYNLHLPKSLPVEDAVALVELAARLGGLLVDVKVELRDADTSKQEKKNGGD